MIHGEGFLLVFSITSKESFDELKAYVDRIHEIKRDVKCPMVLVGNKCDLEEEREVGKELIDAYGRELGCPVVETSAKTRENLDMCFEQIVRVFIEQTEPCYTGNIRK